MLIPIIKCFCQQSKSYKILQVNQTRKYKHLKFPTPWVKWPNYSQLYFKVPSFLFS